MNNKFEVEKNLEVERTMLIFAFRYALGRISYASSIVMDNIKHNIDNITDNDLELYIREIQEAEYLGMDYDIKAWNYFSDYLKDELNKRKNNIRR